MRQEDHPCHLSCIIKLSKKKETKLGWDSSSVGRVFPRIHKVLGLIPRTIETVHDGIYL